MARRQQRRRQPQIRLSSRLQRRVVEQPSHETDYTSQHVHTETSGCAHVEASRLGGATDWRMNPGALPHREHAGEADKRLGSKTRSSSLAGSKLDRRHDLRLSHFRCQSTAGVRGATFGVISSVQKRRSIDLILHRLTIANWLMTISVMCIVA